MRVRAEIEVATEVAMKRARDLAESFTYLNAHTEIPICVQFVRGEDVVHAELPVWAFLGAMTIIEGCDR